MSKVGGLVVSLRFIFGTPSGISWGVKIERRTKLDYNIPRACLLNRSSVLAMVLKSNISGL